MLLLAQAAPLETEYRTPTENLTDLTGLLADISSVTSGDTLRIAKASGLTMYPEIL